MVCWKELGLIPMEDGVVGSSIGQGRMRDGSRCGFGVAATEKDGWDISLKFRVWSDLVRAAHYI